MTPPETIDLPDLEAVTLLGQRLAKEARPGRILALSGDLGAGKTTLAQAVLRALGVTEDITSPTFSLVYPYQVGDLAIYHFDLYRLKHEDELDEIGWDDMLADGFCIVEWPERAGKKLSRNALSLELKVKKNLCRYALIYKTDRSTG